MSQPNAPADDRTIAILAHLSAIIALVISAGWLSWAGPLIVYLIFRNRGGLVGNAAATSFNFNVTIWIAIVVGYICAFTLVLFPVALILWFVPGILQIVFSIIGAVRASSGREYKYPFQIPILH